MNQTDAPSPRPKTMSELFESFTIALVWRHFELHDQNQNFIDFEMPSSISMFPPKVATPFLK